MTEQPRDADGNFVQVRTDKIKESNELNTVGTIDEEYVTPNIQWVNITREFLEEAIEQVEEHGVVRLGTFNRYDEIDGGREAEVGMVALKSNPSDDEVTLVCGRQREYEI
jgi:hypothetical protein